jgi:prepilin-type processing-associated H-X9-DG protein/prepilin-type N-terminal cleavage/methylation domain-containing protein
MGKAMNNDGKKNGFSLTELLVGILIIVVLVAILMATVTNMRDRAAAAGCASNMRQCIALSLMFSAEQNGRLPRLHVNRNLIQGEVGKTLLPVNERTVTNPNTSWWPDLISTYAEAGSMFSCPKLKKNATFGPGGGQSTHVPLGIGISYLIMAPDSIDPVVRWVRLSSVPDLGRVVWFADAGGDVTGDWKARKDDPGYGSCFFRGHTADGKGVMPRHGGKINVGFVDGHVSLVNPSEINWGSTDTNRTKYIGYTKF